MKKMLSIAIAAVMAFTLSMPAFAAATEGQMQNEGQLVTQIGNALASNNVAAAESAAAAVVSAITTTNSDVSNLTAQHVSAVLTKTGTESDKGSIAVAGTSESAEVAIVGNGQSGDAVTVNGMSVTPAANGQPLTVTFEATASGTQSNLGYLVSFVLPASVVGNSPVSASNAYLTYTAADGSTQKLDSVTSVINRADGGVILTAWVPHFSVYNVVFASAGNVNQPDLSGEQNNNGGGNDNGGNNDNGGSTPAATPAPVAASNPIKKTGADMSVALTALAVVAGVALVGGVVAMKKSGLDQ